MGNFLTGSPSTSTATSPGLAKALQPYLVGLLNPRDETTSTVKKKGGGGKGGVLGSMALTGTPFFGGGGGGGKTTTTVNPNRADSLAAFGLNPGAINSSVNTLNSEYNNPNFLNLGSQPGVQSMIGALTNESNTNLDQNLASLRSRFAQGGQTSTFGSSPLLQAQGQTIGTAQESLNDQIAQQLFQMYPQEQQLQQTGLSELQSLNMLPANLLASLGPLLSKSKGATPSPLDAISKIVGSVGSLAGAGAGL